MLARRLAFALAAAALAVTSSGCAAEATSRAGARGTIGYAVEVPAGWVDISRGVAAQQRGGFDAAYGGPTVNGVRTSINVARRKAPRDASLPRLVEQGRREVDALGAGLTFSRPVAESVAGTPGLRYDLGAAGTTARQVGFLRRGSYYVVTLTAAAEAFRPATRRLDAMLRSWRWERGGA